MVMEFQPLIETLGSLKPEKVVGLRRGYADAVAKGVFNRKLVGEYFQRLRGVGEGEGLEPVGGEGWGGGFFGGGMGLKDYEVASLRGGGGAEGIGSDDNDSKVGGEERSDATRRDATRREGPNEAERRGTNANSPPPQPSPRLTSLASSQMSSLGTSLEMALSDFVPMISREGYFVSSLFGLDESEGDNEAVRKRKIESVCGCIQAGAKVVEEGLNTLAGVGGVEVLSNLVGSLKIGETLSTMGKEGGDRYAVEVLTKIKDGADKVWEAWVEDQVAWIEEGHGIPYNGKRAGVFSSFARFPTFVDRVISNVGKHGETSEAITGGIVKIAVALFSSLKSVVERDGTDKQYACHVVVLEVRVDKIGGCAATTIFAARSGAEGPSTYPLTRGMQTLPRLVAELQLFHEGRGEKEGRRGGNLLGRAAAGGQENVREELRQVLEVDDKERVQGALHPVCKHFQDQERCGGRRRADTLPEGVVFPHPG